MTCPHTPKPEIDSDQTDAAIIARIGRTHFTGPARHLLMATIGLTAGDILAEGLSAKGNTP